MNKSGVIKNFTVSMTSRNLTRRHQVHRGVGLRGVIDTAESVKLIKN